MFPIPSDLHACRLAGFHTPTSGSIVVDGMDIQTDRTVVRSNIGVCPQDDAFYDSLTVIEHIEFVAKVMLR